MTNTTHTRRRPRRRTIIVAALVLGLLAALAPVPAGPAGASAPGSYGVYESTAEFYSGSWTGEARDWGHSYVGVDHVHTVDGITGVGAQICVVDTGVDNVSSSVRDLNIGSGYDGISDVTFSAGSSYDRGTHGTGTAGVAAAKWNGRAGLGVAPSATVRSSIALGGPTATGTWNGLVDAIYWCLNNSSVDIINLSLQSGFDHPNVRNAIAYAAQVGKIIVASAGNAWPAYSGTVYPAGYNNVTAVANLQSNGTVRGNSNRGNWVDVAAPGHLTYGLRPNDHRRVRFGGTSAAAAFVSGIAALTLDACNGWIPHNSSVGVTGTQSNRFTQVVRLASVDAGAPGFDTTYGHGIISTPWLMDILGTLGCPDV